MRAPKPPRKAPRSRPASSAPAPRTPRRRAEASSPHAESRTPQASSTRPREASRRRSVPPRGRPATTYEMATSRPARRTRSCRTGTPPSGSRSRTAPAQAPAGRKYPCPPPQTSRRFRRRSARSLRRDIGRASSPRTPWSARKSRNCYSLPRRRSASTSGAPPPRTRRTGRIGPATRRLRTLRRPAGTAARRSPCSGS